MKQSENRWKILAVCLTLTAVLGGCISSEEETQDNEKDMIVVGFSEVGAESDWRVANTESMRNTFVEEDGYELMFEDAKQKQDNQIAAIRNYILQEVDYIVLAPIVETGWDEVLLEAKEAHIPVIVVDRMISVADESLYTAWVGSDFRAEGDMAVEWLEEKLKEQGRENEEIQIVHVQGTEGASAQLGRTAGLEAGLKKHSNWKLAARVMGEFTQAKTYEVILDLLEKGTEMDVIYCENDNSAFGAIQALEEKGVSCGTDGDVMIISFDATRAGLTYCLEGKINLDVECNPLHGPRVASIIAQLEKGEVPDKQWFVSETYFTKENLSQDLIDSREY
ncbi:MAG: ABC transporter substrate-binding protein [Eubacteriales bacterium]|nr:ABC transporter substrate-binding protein [Eubacteriales bacterium]